MAGEDYEVLEKRYQGEAEATEDEKDAVGGEKSLVINNHLIQSDSKANSLASALLTRLKDEKKYFKGVAEYCPVPIEIGDTVVGQERITDSYHSRYPYGDENKLYGDSSRLYVDNGIILAHRGIVRHIKLRVTQDSQELEVNIDAT